MVIYFIKITIIGVFTINTGIYSLCVSEVYHVIDCVVVHHVADVGASFELDSEERHEPHVHSRKNCRECT